MVESLSLICNDVGTILLLCYICSISTFAIVQYFFRRFPCFLPAKVADLWAWSVRKRRAGQVGAFLPGPSDCAHGGFITAPHLTAGSPSLLAENVSFQ